jgi:hypothetical protein
MLLGGRAVDRELRTELGLLSKAGVAILGLPPRVTMASRCCQTAACRGAVLASGALLADQAQLVVDCPNPETTLCVIGAARGAGIVGLRARESPHQVVVTNVAAALSVLGAFETAAAWPR